MASNSASVAGRMLRRTNGSRIPRNRSDCTNRVRVPPSIGCSSNRCAPSNRCGMPSLPSHPNAVPGSFTGHGGGHRDATAARRLQTSPKLAPHRPLALDRRDERVPVRVGLEVHQHPPDRCRFGVDLDLRSQFVSVRHLVPPPLSWLTSLAQDRRTALACQPSEDPEQHEGRGAKRPALVAVPV